MITASKVLPYFWRLDLIIILHYKTINERGKRMKWSFGYGGHLKDTFAARDLHMDDKRIGSIDIDRFSIRDKYGLELRKRRRKDQTGLRDLS